MEFRDRDFSQMNDQLGVHGVHGVAVSEISS